MKQDMYSVTYNPGLLSFSPTKRGQRKQIKFSNTPHHHNIIHNYKQLLSQLHLQIRTTSHQILQQKPDHFILTNSKCPMY